MVGGDPGPPRVTRAHLLQTIRCKEGGGMYRRRIDTLLQHGLPPTRHPRGASSIVVFGPRRTRVRPASGAEPPLSSRVLPTNVPLALFRSVSVNTPFSIAIWTCARES